LGLTNWSDDDHPFIVLTETKLASDIYLFGLDTLLSGPELKAHAITLSP
jgi:hypothetical protein